MICCLNVFLLKPCIEVVSIGHGTVFPKLMKFTQCSSDSYLQTRKFHGNYSIFTSSWPYCADVSSLGPDWVGARALTLKPPPPLQPWRSWRNIYLFHLFQISRLDRLFLILFLSLSHILIFSPIFLHLTSSLPKNYQFSVKTLIEILVFLKKCMQYFLSIK